MFKKIKYQMVMMVVAVFAVPFLFPSFIMYILTVVLVGIVCWGYGYEDATDTFMPLIRRSNKICDRYAALHEEYGVLQNEVESLKLQCRNALEENREAREESDWWKNGEAPPF